MPSVIARQLWIPSIQQLVRLFNAGIPEKNAQNFHNHSPLNVSFDYQRVPSKVNMPFRPTPQDGCGRTCAQRAPLTPAPTSCASTCPATSGSRLARHSPCPSTQQLRVFRLYKKDCARQERLGQVIARMRRISLGRRLTARTSSVIASLHVRGADRAGRRAAPYC